VTTKTVDLSPAATLDTTRVPAIITVACGIVLLFVVGFLQVPAVHNGAHDTRHTNGFPCH
jgi:cobalt transporter subunit CbtB